MPTEITPDKFQDAVRNGFKRLENFRQARVMFMRNYAGQYYDAEAGQIGDEPLNLIFNAMSVIVPNLVMSFPKHVVKTRFLPYREYGDNLGLALDYNAKDIKLRDILRRWIVDALFFMGILKTGLCDSGSAIYFDETDNVDPGTIYTEPVDLDDFTIDPSATSIDKAAWMGHRIRVPRVQLLDSGLYENDLIERLPQAGTGIEAGSESLSMQSIDRDETYELQDEVDLVEIWVRNANAIITVPGSDMHMEDYLRVTEFYGPSTGPFTFLMLTQPPPNNPFPVAPIGIWNDLHVRANRIMSKISDQAERQKDILGYKRSAADDAQEIVDAADGETVAMDDPSAVQTFSFGGQQRSNETHLQQLQMWFNLVSGNIEALGGYKSDAATATQAEILQANGSVRIEDLRDTVYAGVAEEAAKRAWYLHTDPLIQLPLVKRQQIPASYTTGPDGGLVMSPPRMEDVQIFLTPEARQGDLLDFQFEIQPKSMSRLDPATRLRRAMEFGIKLIPAAAQAAQVCMMMGFPFSFKAYIIRMAKEADIEWMDEVFEDPELQMQVVQAMMQTPGMQNSKGVAAGPAMPGGGMAGIRQNGQPPGVATTPSSGQQESHQQAQQGAVPAQQSSASNDTY